MARSSAGLRGGPSRIPLPYRLACVVSYTALVARLVGCGFAPTSLPANAVVAARIPTAWSAPRRAVDGTPTIVGARFSSLDVELGHDWDGDIVTSTNVRAVVLHTNLFDIASTRTSPGRFHFVQHVIDDPAFIVRPYALEIIASGAGDRTAKLVVPFRLRGHGVS